MKQVYDFCYIISDVLFISIMTIIVIKFFMELYAIRIITRCTEDELRSLIRMEFETSNTKMMEGIGTARYMFDKVKWWAIYAFCFFYSIKIILQ